MRAVVLVGGLGTRLRPLTEDFPKQMLPVIHEPMIEHVVGFLASHGIGEIVLSLGFQPDIFRKAYPDGDCAGIQLDYAVEPQPLDTAGAIRFSALHASINETFLVLNGDVLTDLDIGDLVDTHMASGAEGTISLTPVNDPSRYGVVPTDTSGWVTGFIEKPPPHDAPCPWVNGGVYVLEPSILDRIDSGRPVSVEREVFPGMAREGVLRGFHSEAYWVDTGTPETYLGAQLELLGGGRGQAVAGIHDEARVADSAEVLRSVLGRGTVVDEGACICDSVVMADSKVGAGASIEQSIVGFGASIGDEASVSDFSLIGHGAVVSKGENLAATRRA